MKRLSNDKRASLEARLKTLRQTVADLTPGTVSAIVDKVSPDNTDIEGVVKSITKIMESSDKTASKQEKIANLLKKAMDGKETPTEEGKDLENPAIHPFEDAEHEAQTLDDPSLMAEVEKVEEHVKDILNRHDPERHDDSHEEAHMKPELSSEHKLALLMSLPKEQRLAKAANLRALAGVLEDDATEVSQNNRMKVEPDGEMLANDFKDEEYGSMKDVEHTAKLQKGIKTLLASMENVDKAHDNLEDKQTPAEKKDDSMKGKSLDKEALIKLALRHLEASVEDMLKARDEDDKNNDGKKDGVDDKDESEGGMPNWLQDKFEKKNDDKKDDKDEDKKDDWEDKKARLKNRIAGLRKAANVEETVRMETPVEVPKSVGTVEDELHGETKVQYSTNSAADGLDVILDHRTNKEASAGDDAYYSSSKVQDHYQAVGPESDPERLKGGERTLKDEESAVFSSKPTSPSGHIEKGEGTHTKTLEWDKEKDKADMTPTERLTGMASIKEIIRERTVRASKLADKMVGLGLIKTSSQMVDEISTLAQLDDKEFATIASFIGKKVVTATTMDEDANDIIDREDDTVIKNDKEHNKGMNDENKNNKYDENEDGIKDSDQDLHKEARMVRRASRNNEERTASKGLKRPLNLASDVQLSSQKSAIANKIASAAQWTNPETIANAKSAMLDGEHRGGELNMENFLNK